MSVAWTSKRAKELLDIFVWVYRFFLQESTVYITLQKDLCFRSLVKEASVGQYYLCQDEDQEYFRVQVLEVDGPNVFVEYMDFGEKDYLPFSSRLYPMKTSFFDVPFQGIHVLPNDFMQCSNEEEVMGEINKYLLHKELLMDVLHVDDNYDDDDVASPIVTFCDLDGKYIAVAICDCNKIMNFSIS